jgi:uncharacterized protein
MTVPASLSLVTLGVRDVSASTRFYAGLGFELSTASVEGVVSFFKTTGGLLGLFGEQDLADDAHVPPRADSGFRGVSLAMNLADRVAVDQAMAAAEAGGARIVKPAQATDWGGYHGYFADPDDHLWEIAHNPGWPLGPNGHPQLP